MISAFGVDHGDVSKADKRDAIVAGSAALGAGAGQGMYQQAGYSTKHYVDRHTRKGGKGVTSAQVNRQDKVLKPVKRQYGMHLPHSDPGRSNVGYHRAYPKTLPYGRTIRTLGHTHEGKLGMATGAAVTALGGLGGAGIAAGVTKKPVKKNWSLDTPSMVAALEHNQGLHAGKSFHQVVHCVKCQKAMKNTSLHPMPKPSKPPRRFRNRRASD